MFIRPWSVARRLFASGMVKPMIRALCIALAGLLLLPPGGQAADKLVMWHSYRGAERAALEKVVAAWNATKPAAEVELLMIPYQAFADRITAAIPRGKGPDLFVFAHDRLG